MRRCSHAFEAVGFALIAEVVWVWVALAFPLVAHAQSHQFNIPAQGLVGALKEFGIQADHQVLFSPDVVAGRQGNAVIGDYEATRALQMLLSGTGLTYERTAANILLIKEEPKREDPPPAVGAQKRSAAPGSGVEIEEITVTAQKREESIQETPISITALSGEALVQKGVGNVVDIAGLVPNMRVSGGAQSGESTLQVTLRGLTQINAEPGLPEKIGLYVDGALISKMRGSNLDLEDLERVEVLRGPQGTLYGRNTIGGAVNFITRKPTEERSITLDAQAGNFNAFKTRVTFNVPLIGKNGYAQSDALGTLSLRETAGYKAHDGYYRNDLEAGMPSLPRPGGTNTYSDVNRVYNFTALRWKPNKDVTVDYSFEYHRYRDTEDPRYLTGVYPGSPVSFPQLPVPGVGLVPNPFYMTPYIQKNRSDVVPGTLYALPDGSLHRHLDDGNERMHTLTGEWDLGEIAVLGDVRLKSISSYRGAVADMASGVGGGPTHVFDPLSYMDLQHWSEELQMIGTTPRTKYVLGAYYYGEYYTSRSSQFIFGGASRAAYRNFGNLASYAGYGQLTYTPPVLSDKLSMTAGLRFTQEQLHISHMTGAAAMPHATGGSFHLVAGKAFGGLHGDGLPGVSPMADISYQWTNDLMTYARVSRGFTGGTINPASALPILFTPVKPERLWEFEAGFKSDWFEKRLRFNADGFLGYYQDYQAATSNWNPQYGVLGLLSNVERAEIWGMETDAAVIPFRGMEVTASYSFLAPKYTKWDDLKISANGLPVFDAAGNPVMENVADKRSFPFSPNNIINVGLTYTAPPTTTGTFSAHLDVSWQDKSTFIPNNTALGGQMMEGWAYALVDGRLSYAGIPLAKGSLDVALFAKNLLDRKYRTWGIDTSAALGLISNLYGPPRTFGVQLTYNFSES